MGMAGRLGGGDSSLVSWPGHSVELVHSANAKRPVHQRVGSPQSRITVSRQPGPVDSRARGLPRTEAIAGSTTLPRHRRCASPRWPSGRRASPNWAANLSTREAQPAWGSASSIDHSRISNRSVSVTIRIAVHAPFGRNPGSSRSLAIFVPLLRQRLTAQVADQVRTVRISPHERPTASSQQEIHSRSSGLASVLGRSQQDNRVGRHLMPPHPQPLAADHRPDRGAQERWPR